jgi:hypothetical protein
MRTNDGLPWKSDKLNAAILTNIRYKYIQPGRLLATGSCIFTAYSILHSFHWEWETCGLAMSPKTT